MEWWAGARSELAHPYDATDCSLSDVNDAQLLSRAFQTKLFSTDGKAGARMKNKNHSAEDITKQRPVQRGVETNDFGSSGVSGRSLVSVSLLGRPHIRHSSATRVFGFSARRAAGPRPRREPWVRPDTNIISPEGAALSGCGASVGAA